MKSLPLLLFLILAAPQDPPDPAAAVAAALDADRLEEAATLLEKLEKAPEGAAPAQLEGLRARLRQAQTAQAVRVHFEAGKAAAEERVREARTSAGDDLREGAARDARFERALQDLTARTPLRVPLTESVTLENVRVSAYSRGQVVLTWPQGSVEYPLVQLAEETRSTLVAGALAKATPRDHFEMGKLLLAAKDYERAARCFATASQRDPALAAFVPDLDRVKRAGRLFEGSFRTAGNTLSLRWNFGSPADLGDFEAIRGACSLRPGQGLEVSGDKLALVAVREIPFRDRVRVSMLAKESDAACHLLGIRFLKPDGGEVVLYGALATAQKIFLVIRSEDDKVQELLPPTAGSGGNRMTMELNRGRITFQVGERTVWSGPEGGFTDVTALVGATAIPKPGAPARLSAFLKEVTLSGEVNPRWMAKKMAGLRDALGAEMSKEFRAKKQALAATEQDLSVEPALRRADPAAIAAYQGAIARIVAMRKSQLVEDLVAARAAMAQVCAAYADFAPAWYQQGVLAEIAGDARAAAGHYDQALRLLPPFPEALAARARLAALDGQWDAAAGGVERALALRPDFAELQLLRARIQWEKRDAASALESTFVARRLAPFDADLQSRAQMLANVARGPGWAKGATHQSAHYRVRSDLAEAKCRLYAEHLEALRSLYEEVLGRALPQTQPAEVLLFNSEEGYFNYMDFSSGSRLEHTLGAFSPWHGQMALYEGVEVSETLRVLAHEGFHQALHGVAPQVPIWFNEGMAEYVGAARVEKGSVVERGGILGGRLENLKMALLYGWSPEPFERLMLQSQAEFYNEQAPFKYAQAWSMIRYFLHGDDGRWKPLLKQYVERLLAGDDAAAAFETTFGKQDLKALEAGWLKFYGFVVRPRSAKAAAKAPETPAEAEQKTLLGGTALAESRWTLQGGALLSPDGGGRLDLAYVAPEEYDWEMQATCLTAGSVFGFGLRTGEGSCLLRMEEGQLLGLENVGGRPLPNETAQRMFRGFFIGKPCQVVCSVRKGSVQLTVDGVKLLGWNGDLRRLSLPAAVGAPPKPRTLFLWSGNGKVRIEAMRVTMISSGAPSAAEADKSPLPKTPIDPERSIVLEEEVRQWFIDEEKGQILALAPKAGLLLVLSIADRRVLQKIPVGAGPVAITPAPGSGRMFWVANEEAKTLVKVDLEKSAVVETLPLTAAPKAVVAVRKYLWWVPDQGTMHGVDLSDKRELIQMNGGALRSLLYDARRDRLLGFGYGVLVEYDSSKIGVILRELTRKNLDFRTSSELNAGLAKATKTYDAPPLRERGESERIFLDERNGRLYLGNAAFKLDKLEAAPRIFPAPPNPAMDGASANANSSDRKLLEEIGSASPDGKWVASGTHLFNAATGAVLRELPVPTLLTAFSKDSKQLAYFDRANRAIVTIDVEKK